MTVRYHVEPWSPEYGTSVGAELDDSSIEVDATPEADPDGWEPITPPAGYRPERLLFVDGVRRVDARLWLEEDDGTHRLGVAASYGAGVVCCAGTSASLVEARVGRGLFAPGDDLEPLGAAPTRWEPHRSAGEAPEELWLAVQNQMTALEVEVATDAGAAQADTLVVVDGPLGSRAVVGAVVGYVKTHEVRYLEGRPAATVAALGAGQRTPLFRLGGRFPRWSWYLRLPTRIGHPWTGVVRLEAPADVPGDQARGLADAVTAVLPRFANQEHKDARAPQNLHPIAGLERLLRHRLGDPAVLERTLRLAARAATPMPR